MPNRVYRDLNPQLEMEGSSDKGSFKGDTLQQTQPAWIDDAGDPAWRWTLIAVSAAGQLLIVAAGVALYLALAPGSNGAAVSVVLASVAVPVLLWWFGHALLRLAHWFRAELRFSSCLVNFFGEGTYTQSKISTGMAITDSHRSENTIVRASFSPWLLVSRLTSSTFATSGTDNLSGPRLTLEMHTADDLMMSLIDGLREFIRNREVIADGSTEGDLHNAARIVQLNDQTRALGSGPAPSLLDAGGAVRREADEQR